MTPAEASRDRELRRVWEAAFNAAITGTLARYSIAYGYSPSQIAAEAGKVANAALGVWVETWEQQPR